MKNYRFKQLEICALSCIILIFNTHLAKGETLEYQVEFEEEKITYSQEAWEADPKWRTVTKISLKSGETLNVQKAGMIRDIFGRPTPVDLFEVQNQKYPNVRFTFKQTFLNKEIKIRYDNIVYATTNKRIFADGKEINANLSEYYSFNDLVKYNMLVGPAEVTVEATKLQNSIIGQNREKVWIYSPKQILTIRLNKSSNVSSSAQSVANKNILVLPKGTGVNELILESSEDLITWEKDVPGDKNTDSGNRFYRLRAIKK